MKQMQNFQETIDKLMNKLDKSINDLNDIKLKYKNSQEKIDQLNVSVQETKDQILEVVHPVNDLLIKLNVNFQMMNIEDLKKLTNVETLRVINNVVRFLNTKF